MTKVRKERGMAWEQETGLEARFPPLSRVGSSFLPETRREGEERGLFSRTAAGNRAYWFSEAVKQW